MRKRPIVPHPTDPSIALVALPHGMFAIISVVDAEAVGAHNWNKLSGEPYAKANINKQVILLHRFVAGLMGLPLTDEIDHINRNGLDCRRSNLRQATRWHNAQNRTRLPRSGVRGVYRSHRDGRWYARLIVDGVNHFLGYFDTVEDARAAREAGVASIVGAADGNQIQ